MEDKYNAITSRPNIIGAKIVKSKYFISKLYNLRRAYLLILYLDPLPFLTGLYSCNKKNRMLLNVNRLHENMEKSIKLTICKSELCDKPKQTSKWVRFSLHLGFQNVLIDRVIVKHKQT